ncbi:MAG: hypothetical protein ACK4M9_01940 [Anaerobacillus sp.]
MTYKLQVRGDQLHHNIILLCGSISQISLVVEGENFLILFGNFLS